MNPPSVDALLVRTWAIEFNREHREASVNASTWRLRFAVVIIFGGLVFLAGRALAETNADAPTGKPDATIDLATKEDVDLVKGQWRYSNTKIIEVDFKAAGPDKKSSSRFLGSTDRCRTRLPTTSTCAKRSWGFTRTARRRWRSRPAK